MIATTLVFALGLASPDCISPCCGCPCSQLVDDEVKKDVVAPVEVGLAAAAGGLAGELAVSPIWAVVAKVAGDDPPIWVAWIYVGGAILVWPIGSAAFAEETAQKRGLSNPWEIAWVTFGVSALVFGGGLIATVAASGVPFDATPSDEQWWTFGLGLAGTLIGSSIASGLAAGITAALDPGPPEPVDLVEAPPVS